MAEVTISDDVVVVNLTLDNGDAAEAGQKTGAFTLTRSDNGNPAQALDVIVDVSGNAGQFNDYNASNLIHYAPPNYRLQIPGGQSSISSTITPILDNLVEGPESAIFTLQPTVNYAEGISISATITIADFVEGIFKDGFED